MYNLKKNATTITKYAICTTDTLTATNTIRYFRYNIIYGVIIAVCHDRTYKRKCGCSNHSRDTKCICAPNNWKQVMMSMVLLVSNKENKST